MGRSNSISNSDPGVIIITIIKILYPSVELKAATKASKEMCVCALLSI